MPELCALSVARAEQFSAGAVSSLAWLQAKWLPSLRCGRCSRGPRCGWWIGVRRGPLLQLRWHFRTLWDRRVSLEHEYWRPRKSCKRGGNGPVIGGQHTPGVLAWKDSITGNECLPRQGRLYICRSVWSKTRALPGIHAVWWPCCWLAWGEAQYSIAAFCAYLHSNTRPDIVGCLWGCWWSLWSDCELSWCGGSLLRKPRVHGQGQDFRKWPSTPTSETIRTSDGSGGGYGCKPWWLWPFPDLGSGQDSKLMIVSLGLYYPCYAFLGILLNRFITMDCLDISTNN